MTGDSWNGANFDWVTIKYAASEPATPPTLNIQRLGNNIILNWTNAAFGLQSAPANTGTFTNIPGATSPHTNSLIGGQRFFRLAQWKGKDEQIACNFRPAVRQLSAGCIPEGFRSARIDLKESAWGNFLPLSYQLLPQTGEYMRLLRFCVYSRSA